MGKKFTPTFRFPHSCVTVYVISIELHQVIISLLLQPLATLRLFLGTQVQIVGGRESLYGRKKRRPRRIVKNGVKNPWDNGETSSKQSSLFWLLIDVRKVLCFSLQSEGSRPWSRFVCKQSTLSLAVRHVYHGFSRMLYAQGERFNIRTKCKGKRSVNTLDLSALVVIKVAYLIVCEIFTDLLNRCSLEFFKLCLIPKKIKNRYKF